VTCFTGHGAGPGCSEQAGEAVEIMRHLGTIRYSDHSGEFGATQNVVVFSSAYTMLSQKKRVAMRTGICVG
jgi:hypothetical protein